MEVEVNSMKLYKDYTTLEIILNKPCVIDDYCVIHPISMRDYNEFQKYIKYIMLSKKQLGLNSKDPLLQSVIMASVYFSIERPFDASDGECLRVLDLVLRDICNMFQILTKKEINYNICVDGSFEFVGEGILIDNDNYEIVRDLTMKFALLKEPRVFEDKLYEKMYYRSLKANRKEGASLEDIILTVVQDMKYTFDYIYELNVVQLYSLYSRIVHVKNSDAITIFRTCSSQLPNVNFTDEIVDKLYTEESDDDLFVSLDKMAGML